MSQETQHEEIFAEVDSELIYQGQEWGSPSDDKHPLPVWNELIGKYNARGLAHIDKRTRRVDPNGWRRRMVQVAALAISAIASFDRKCEESAEMVSERGIDPHVYPACSERPGEGPLDG